MFIGRLDTAEEAVGVENLIQLAFPEGEEYQLYRIFLEHYPGKDELGHVVAVEDRIVVGYAMIIPQKLSFGGEIVECDRIGFVATHPDYRGKGIMTSLMKKVMQYISERKRPLSVIYGIPYFYRRFGYEYAIPDDTFGPYSTIPLDKINSKGYATRSPEPNDIKKLDAFYKKADKDATVRAKRSMADWYFQEALISSLDGQGTVVFTLKNRVKGYARYHHAPQGMVVNEIEGEGLTKKENQDKFLAALKTMASKGENELCLGLPPTHVMMKTVSRLGGEKRRMHYGAYVKITHLKILFNDIRSILEHNIEESDMADYTGSVLMDAYEEKALISFEKGKITGIESYEEEGESDIHIRVPPGVLTQLVTGYKQVKDVSDTCDLITNVEGIKMLESLFPQGRPYMSYNDRW